MQRRLNFILDARPLYDDEEILIPYFAVTQTSIYVVVLGFFVGSFFSLTEHDFFLGHPKPEKVPSKTETRKEETGADFGKPTE